MRPISAPLVRGNAFLPPQQQEHGEGDAGTGRPRTLQDVLSPKERADRSDPRTVISHPDVQLLHALAQNGGQGGDDDTDEADLVSRPMGFSQRPSTAAARRMRWQVLWRGHGTEGAFARTCIHGQRRRQP